MGVTYISSAGTYNLIPAPLVNINKSYIRDEAGNKLRPEYAISLTGKIVNIGVSGIDSPGATVDSAYNNGVAMMGYLSEQQRIRQIFSKDGGKLNIATPVGTNTYDLNFYCQVEDIRFPQSTWVYLGDYEIDLKAVILDTDGESYEELDSTKEDWSINENQDGTFNISHQLQAVGALIYTSSGVNDPLISARNWVSSKRYGISTSGFLYIPPNGFDFSTSLTDMELTYTGIDIPGLNILSLSALQTLALAASSGNFWNYASNESIGWNNRTWAFNETWIYYPSGSVREVYNITLNYDNNDLRHVNTVIDGTIYGYADRISNLELKNSRAKNYFYSTVDPNLYIRVSGYVPSGYTLSPVPIIKTVSYDRTEGIVRYTESFAASSGNLIPNTIDESLSIQDTGGNDIFAVINIPGRSQGSLVQNMNTTTLPERTISINATLIGSTTALTTGNLRSLYLAKPNTDAIISALTPESGYYYIKSNSEDFNVIKRTYSRQTSWVLDRQGHGVNGIPSTIHNIQ